MKLEDPIKLPFGRIEGTNLYDINLFAAIFMFMAIILKSLSAFSISLLLINFCVTLMAFSIRKINDPYKWKWRFSVFIFFLICLYFYDNRLYYLFLNAYLGYFLAVSIVFNRWIGNIIKIFEHKTSITIIK